MEYILKCGDLTAITDTQGGELISLKDGAGTEYIWHGDPRYWSGRNPVLFPIVGRLKDGKVRFSDETAYEMAQHGFGRRSEFSVVDQGKDYIVFQLQESENTLRIYPFPFALNVRHQLLNNGFYTRFEVVNSGSTPMPFCIGAHTAFNCPIREGERFEDYRLVFDQEEDLCSILPTGQGYLHRNKMEHTLDHSDTIQLDYAIFDRIDTLVYDGLRSTGVSLLNADNHGVHMDFEGFPMIAFWSKPNSCAPFLCLEPWHGCAAYEDETGTFEEKAHCITLRPGERKALQYTVTLV